MDELEKNHKKVAIRFLKDTGLLPYWKKFLDHMSNCIPVEKNSAFWKSDKVYAKSFIENIFGDTCFTHFLSEYLNLEEEPYTKVYEYFMWWLENEGLDFEHEMFSLDNMRRLGAEGSIERDIKYFYEKIKKC